MKILYITPENPYIVTPETYFATLLTKLGHQVHFTFTPNAQEIEKLIKEDYDIVYGAMEYSMNVALYIGKLINKPVYNHMEWVPPWRVGLEPQEDWGYDGTTASAKHNVYEIMQFRKMYKQQVTDWENSTIRSCAGIVLEPYIEAFATKRPLDCEIKYYCANFDLLEKYKDAGIKEKYQIMSTARLVPHKKIVHIVRALAKLKNPPPYKVIGYGPEQIAIQNEAIKLGIDIEFLGPGQNGLKERTIQESLFSINIWAGTPIAESFYYKKPAISYGELHMKEIFGNSVFWAERNNIDSLAKKIQYLLDNSQKRKDLGERGHYLMMNDKINMGTPDHLGKALEKILLKGIDKWQK
jgi:glycosyltransferase involved in cell wall biosynthesis